MGDRILLVEDDPRLGAQIVGHLRSAGFEPLWWTEGRDLLPGNLPDVSLVVLDLMLPGTYGLDMLKALRAFSEVPVLILSARNDTLDKVRALKLGADDYVTKPFWPEELIERVRARLRRPTLQKAESVLERGFRGSAARTRAPQGQGLGLHITHQVAQWHGWTLTLAASEYGGLEVSFAGDSLPESEAGRT